MEAVLVLLPVWPKKHITEEGHSQPVTHPGGGVICWEEEKLYGFGRKGNHKL